MPWPERVVHNDHAGLVSVFRRRRAGDDFEGLDGIEGNLVRKDFALLVGDGLAVNGKRVFARGRPGHETGRWNRRRFPAMASVTSELSEEDWLSRGILSNESAIHVGVKGGIVLHQVAAALRRSRFRKIRRPGD